MSFNSWSYFDAKPRAAGDIDGDGLCDIVGFNNDGLYVAFAKIDRTFEPVVKIDSASCYFNDCAWSTFSSYPRYVKDVNKDGKADIIGFSGSGVEI
mmetsp:Transcript_13798/g.1241  ORF Transcript_13798/g.1241 Transcript_13798/m.1241 type:complete len:96 (+) Transcript_13798:672-959(+)